MRSKAILICLLICVFISDGFGQRYKSARVTDYFHFVRSKYPFGYSLDYFSENPEWSLSLINLADSLIRQHFKLHEVNFQMSTVTFREVEEYAYGSALSPPPVVGFKNIPRNNEDLYIAIFSTFGYSGDIFFNEEDNATRKLLLKVIVENKKGKKVYKQKVKAPFYLQPSNYLYDNELNKEDFQNLYEDVLCAAWQNKRKLKKRTLNYQHLNFYDSFVEDCNYYAIAETIKDGKFDIYNTTQENIGALNLSGSTINREFTEEFFDINVSNRLRQSGHLTNNLAPSSYDFIAGFSITESYDSANIYPDKALVIFKENGVETGRFALLNYDQLIGSFGEHYYQLKYIDGPGVYELFIEDEMVGVIQKGKHQKEDKKMRQYYNSFFLKSLSKDELGTVLNVYIAYQLAYQIEMEALQEEME